MPPNKGGIFFVFVGNIPFLLAKRGCLDREEYFRAAQIDVQFQKNYMRRCFYFLLLWEIFRFRLRNAVVQTVRNISKRRKLSFNLPLTVHAVMRCLKYFYTKLVFFSTTLLIAPRPNANSEPPAAQSATLIMVEPRGVIIETIIKRSIPPPSEPPFDASLCR